MPPLENLPTSQSVQSVEPDVCDERFPAAHEEQVESPAADLVPAPHGSQAVAVGLGIVPALQFVQTDAPAAENLPG